MARLTYRDNKLARRKKRLLTSAQKYRILMYICLLANIAWAANLYEEEILAFINRVELAGEAMKWLK